MGETVAVLDGDSVWVKPQQAEPQAGPGGHGSVAHRSTRIFAKRFQTQRLPALPPVRTRVLGWV